MKERQTYIDISKALCIILVVVGHFNPSVEPTWWPCLLKWIYSFHMPAFFFLSGLLYSMTIHPEEIYTHFMGRKLKRLMIPYLSVSVIIIGTKLLIQTILPVKNKVTAYALVQMLWYPSAASHLWFLWTLLFAFAIVRVANDRKWAINTLLIVSIIWWFLPFTYPKIFRLDRLPMMLCFFVLGLFIGRIKQAYIPRQKRNIARVSIIILYIIAEGAYLWLNDSPKILYWLTACLGTFTLIIFAKWLIFCRKENAKFSVVNILILIGECSFFIYLFHTTFMEFVKIILPKIGITIQQHYLLTLFIVTITGIVVPLLVQKLLIEKSKILSFLFGVSRTK